MEKPNRFGNIHSIKRILWLILQKVHANNTHSCSALFIGTTVDQVSHDSQSAPLTGNMQGCNGVLTEKHIIIWTYSNLDVLHKECNNEQKVFCVIAVNYTSQMWLDNNNFLWSHVNTTSLESLVFQSKMWACQDPCIKNL